MTCVGFCAAGRTGATTSFLVRKEAGSEHLSTDVGLVGETKKMRYYSCLLVQVAVTPMVSIFFYRGGNWITGGNKK